MVWQPPQARLAQPLRVLEATPAWTIQSGQFTACVELGQPGRYPLRVLEQDPGVTSKPFVLVIQG